MQEQIGVRPAQLPVEGIHRIQTMHLVVDGSVRRRIAQDEQRVEQR